MKRTSDLILLDTHAWVWMLEGYERLHRSSKFPVLAKASEDFRLRISIMSVWEVGMLEAKKRLRLPCSVHRWVETALGAPGISLTAITPEIALDSTRLPGEFHNDPADRIIVSTARLLGARLATWDKKIMEYAKQNYVKVL